MTGLCACGCGSAPAIALPWHLQQFLGITEDEAIVLYRPTGELLGAAGVREALLRLASAAAVYEREAVLS